MEFELEPFITFLVFASAQTTLQILDLCVVVVGPLVRKFENDARASENRTVLMSLLSAFIVMLIVGRQ